MELWDRLGTPIINKKRCTTLELKRLEADAVAIKPFFSMVEVIAAQFPEYAEEQRKLNTDKSPGARQPDDNCREGVTSVPSVPKPSTLKDGHCPQSVTLITTPCADGTIGPLGIVQENDKPLPSHWFAGQLPPGIDKEWIDDLNNVFFGYNDTSDRVRFDLWMDILTNVLLPFHRSLYTLTGCCFGTLHAAVTVARVYQVDPRAPPSLSSHP